jgi:ABC-type transport system involved in multi-copper enzyme maturation permease subunit
MSEIINENLQLSKYKGLNQINRTISFELSRNLKKLIGMALTNTIIVVLFLIINELQDTPPDLAVDYAQSYLSMLSFIIIIIGILFGSSMIVEDFEKQTGNLLFPKIEKGRLLVGRYIARYFYAMITIVVFYGEIAFLTYINYSEVPSKLWGSMLWAILYLHLVLSFVVLMSALLNRIATTTVVSILALLILFSIITNILMVAEVKIEPLFVLTYYSNIITSWFAMPETRYRDISPRFGGPNPQDGVSDRVFRQWVTPSAEGALIGILLYSIVLLTIAVLVYRNKQSKS